MCDNEHNLHAHQNEIEYGACIVTRWVEPYQTNRLLDLLVNMEASVLRCTLLLAGQGYHTARY